eukprot:CAMPEP_0178738574 /NCGR_PEP_ID=MMETSP0744-20121128/3589_1 /TAXON_ID=913974 /ORGANISM="Nitzschia punctata, Strain CCMP561" /LENGTH=548 /DNA_ID=CAMNT_0020391209 /DNA_START=36 /DNA_END=1682 /DNA_ORIENTATION=-
MNPIDQHHQFVFSSAGRPAMSLCNNHQQGGGRGNHQHNNNCFVFPNLSLFQQNNRSNNHHQSSSSSTTNAPSIEEAERELANAMMNLTMEDRERAMEDLHGVYGGSGRRRNDETQEEEEAQESTTTMTDEETERALHEMDELLQRDTNYAYQLAQQQSPKYVQDRNFRLSFLRSSTTVSGTAATTQQAVKKVLGYFDVKLRLFGSDALCRDITLSDLDDDVMECLEAGFYQYIGKDSVGRTVIGAFPCLLRYKSVDVFVKMSFYLWMHFFPLQKSNDRGVVILQYSSGMEDPPTNASLIWREITQFETLPIKCCAYHVALDSRAQNSISFQVIKVAQRASNVRTTFHFGRHMEVQYELRRFGIDTNALAFPVSLNGELTLKHHNQWIQERKREELPTTLEASASRCGTKSNGIAFNYTPQTTKPQASAAKMLLVDAVVPTDNDVMFGRGFTAQHHPGNIKFRRFLEKHYDAYTRGDDFDKLVLVDYLSHQMTTSLGVRFLKVSPVDKTSWVEVEDKEAIRSKLYQTFRNLRASYRRMEKQQQQQQHGQ